MLFSLPHHITLVLSCFYGIEKNIHIKFVSDPIFLIYQWSICKRNTCDAVNERMSMENIRPFVGSFGVCHKQTRMLFILLSKSHNKIHIQCLVNAIMQPSQWKIGKFSRAELKHDLPFSMVIINYQGVI